MPAEHKRKSVCQIIGHISDRMTASARRCNRAAVKYERWLEGCACRVKMAGKQSAGGGGSCGWLEGHRDIKWQQIGDEPEKDRQVAVERSQSVGEHRDKARTTGEWMSIGRIPPTIR